MRHTYGLYMVWWPGWSILALWYVKVSYPSCNLFLYRQRHRKWHRRLLLLAQKCTNDTNHILHQMQERTSLNSLFWQLNAILIVCCQKKSQNICTARKFIQIKLFIFLSEKIDRHAKTSSAVHWRSAASPFCNQSFVSSVSTLSRSPAGMNLKLQDWIYSRHQTLKALAGKFD